MSSTNWTSRLCAVVAASAMIVPVVGSAQSLQKVMDAEKQRTKLAQQSQQRIDKIVDETQKKEDQYARLLKEIEGLKIYNTLLQRQIDGQVRKMAQLEESIQQVEVISRQIVPSMVSMIDALDSFIKLDVPFLEEERATRVANLRSLMEEPDVNDAEKFRKVTEAYQIENDYGRTIEASDGTLDIDGQTLQGQFLRIGRVAYMFQNQDATVSRVWNQKSREWEDGSAYKNDIKEGLKIANKQIAPELLLLPVAAPEAG